MVIVCCFNEYIFLTYNCIPNWLYYSVTLPTYAIVILCACLIPDVEIVINFVGSLANSVLNFVLPGSYYFIVMYNIKQKWKIILALLFAIYGIIMGVFCTGVNVWTTISPI